MERGIRLKFIPGAALRTGACRPAAQLGSLCRISQGVTLSVALRHGGEQ
jgi:hypothetical protein